MTSSEHHKIRGYSAAFAATLLLGALGIFVRNIQASESVITFGRVGFGFIFLTIYLVLTKQTRFFKLEKFSIYLVWTGLLISFTSLCYVNAITATSLANAVFLLYLGPLLAVGIASVILKEKFSLLNAALLLIAFLGFLFLLEFKFSFSGGEGVGYLWGGGAGLCYALAIVFNRQIPESIPTYSRAFYQFLFGSLIMIPFLDASLLNVTLSDVYWLLGAGFLQGFVAFTLAIYALKQLRAIEFGTISYIEPLMAAVLGFALYSESLSVMQLIGCGIVLLGGFMQVIKKT